VHVPDTWGGWRVHSTGATAAVHLTSAEHARRVTSMIADAVARCEVHLEPAVRGALTSRWVAEAEEMRSLRREIATRSGMSVLRRRAHLVKRFCGSRAAREHVMARAAGKPLSEWVARRLAACGCGPLLEPLDGRALAAGGPSGILLSHT
jgi:hypothetical protein